MPPKPRAVPPTKTGATGSTAGKQGKVSTTNPSGKKQSLVGRKLSNRAIQPGAKSSNVGKKGAAKAGGTSTSKGAGPPKKPVWSKEDDMARKIQLMYRGYRARKMLRELKEKKDKYDALMLKLQQEVARMERERAEEQRKRDEDALKRRKESSRRIKRMLEAAFDGDIQEINDLLEEVKRLQSDAGEAIVSRHQYKLVECTDPNGNTPLSEASAGGDMGTIKLLVKLGADPNVKGQFGRTPLYRASFAGHLDAVKILLELGADLRIFADDGAKPEQVAARKIVAEVLGSWDIKITEGLLQKLEKIQITRHERDKKLKEDTENEVQHEIDEAEREYSTLQKQLAKAYEELNKRICEYDEYGADKEALTLPAVHDAEDHLERCKLHAEDARKKLQQARLKLRMKRREFLGIVMEEAEEEKTDVIVNIRELDDVLIKDVGDHIASSGKWPLIIDSGQQASTFLRYRDTNYLNVCNPNHMNMETIRMALLGAIRYGKFAVLDMLDIEDAWSSIHVKFEEVKKGLLSSLMSKELMKNDKYLSLVHPSDGEEYSDKMFGERVKNFKLVILTQLHIPPKEVSEQCYVIQIHTPQDFD